MSRTTTAAAAVTLGVVVLAAIGWWAQRSSPLTDEVPARRPNVLIVVWDTVRADRLSLYGHHRPTTPALDRRATSARVFESAHSPGIWTLPAHAAMFTGLPAQSTGADERWLWLDGYHLTAAEHFGEAGWDTFSFAANALLSADTNLLQGFRVQWNSYAGRAAPLAKAATRRKILPEDASNELAPGWSRPSHGATNAEWGRAIYKEAGPVIATGFLKWVDERRTPDAPFFAYLNLMEAHTPRLPSMTSRRAVLADDPELIPLGLQTDQAHIKLHFYNFGHQDYSQRELQAIRGVYDATLRDLDDATETILAGLESRGMLDDTIVVLTSDHGENLGDHGLFNHRFALWQSLTRVPLVVWGPGIESGRVAEPVSTQSLFATLCGLTELACPDTVMTTGTWFEPGPAITHMATPLKREIDTVAAIHPEIEVEPWMRSGHAVVADGLSVQRLDDGTIRAFDLQADPHEQMPLDSSRAVPLLDVLDGWLATVPAYDRGARGPGDDPAHVRASQEELRAQLEALGYATGSDD